MTQESQTERTQIIQREGGISVTIHFDGDRPSLQEKMEEIISFYQTKSAKI